MTEQGDPQGDYLERKYDDARLKGDKGEMLYNRQQMEELARRRHEGIEVVPKKKGWGCFRVLAFGVLGTGALLSAIPIAKQLVDMS